ncbi:hypothetical protein LCM20_12460 [Halobacillus litoralis]|uniref:hypothetical protein n=1 Tax=Halobacillus litoralis TaxID=45668 RepID=UPI001CD7CF6C|nr:hypothetical protein [Halobacillus litoralis]MCA0971409.1 hypothetical protein [Halobacillus litoralis]
MRGRSFFTHLFHRKKRAISLLGLLLIIGGAVLVMNKEEHVKATWIWDLESLDQNYDKAVSFAEKQDVTLIYLHVSRSGLDEKEVADFIKQANEADIQVYALGGDPNWAKEESNQSLEQFYSVIQSYNAQASKEKKFKGIHLDIEPYLLPEWKKNRDDVITQWTTNVSFFQKKVESELGLPVSGDLPFWIYKIPMPDGKQYVSEWMIDHLDSITVMAYRDFTSGNNGIKRIASPLVEQAANESKSVVIAVNVLNTDEGAHTTFHGNPPHHMKNELNLLNRRFTGHPGYAGVAIHDYASWLEMEEQTG